MTCRHDPITWNDPWEVIPVIIIVISLVIMAWCVYVAVRDA